MKIPQEKPFRMGERIMSGNLISKMHNLSSDTIDECYVTEPRKRIFMLFPTFFLFSSQCKYELCQFLFDDIFEYSEKKMIFYCWKIIPTFFHSFAFVGAEWKKIIGWHAMKISLLYEI